MVIELIQILRISVRNERKIIQYLACFFFSDSPVLLLCDSVGLIVVVFFYFPIPFTKHRGGVGQSQSKVKQNQCNFGLLSALN